MLCLLDGSKFVFVPSFSLIKELSTVPNSQQRELSTVQNSQQQTLILCP